MGGKEIKEKIIDLMFKNFGNCPKRLPTQILKLFSQEKEELLERIKLKYDKAIEDLEKLINQIKEYGKRTKN